MNIHGTTFTNFASLAKAKQPHFCLTGIRARPMWDPMFPFRDHNPSETTPYVTWALIAVNVVVFLSYFSLFSDERALSQFFLTWGIVPAQLGAGQGYDVLVTSMFLHGGLMHLGGNMLFLWIFGDNLEDAMGRLTYLGFYLLSGIAAGLMQIAAAPFSNIPIVGASGAIAGVMGGYLLLYPRARIDVLLIIVFFIRIIPVPAWSMLGLWFGFQLIGGVGDNGSGGGVAYWAHAGGFIAGGLLAIPIWLKRGGTRGWRTTHGLPPHPEARYRTVRTTVPKVSRRPRSRGPWG